MSDVEFKENNALDFEKKSFPTHLILKSTFFVWSDSELKTSQHVRFWTDEKDIASDFELKNWNLLDFVV